MNDVKAIREARGKTTIHKSASPFPSAENGPGLSPCSLRNCVKKKTKRRRQFTKERRARGWKWMNGNRLARRSRGGRKFHSQSAAAASTFRVWVCVGLVFPAFRSFLGVVCVTQCVCVCSFFFLQVFLWFDHELCGVCVCFFSEWNCHQHELCFLLLRVSLMTFVT